MTNIERPQFSQIELVEIGDAISETLGRLLSSGDTDRNESQYGTLTLLHEAQGKLLPVALGFSHHDVDWAYEQAERIKKIRVGQGLPALPDDSERARWSSTVTAR